MFWNILARSFPLLFAGLILLAVALVLFVKWPSGSTPQTDAPMRSIINGPHIDRYYSEGYWAHQSGKTQGSNPYSPDDEAYDQWLDGWNVAHDTMGCGNE